MRYESVRMGAASAAWSSSVFPRKWEEFTSVSLKPE